jgi:hypothetical protein
MHWITWLLDLAVLCHTVIGIQLVLLLAISVLLKHLFVKKVGERKYLWPSNKTVGETPTFVKSCD